MTWKTPPSAEDESHEMPIAQILSCMLFFQNLFQIYTIHKSTLGVNFFFFPQNTECMLTYFNQKGHFNCKRKRLFYIDIPILHAKRNTYIYAQKTQLTKRIYIHTHTHILSQGRQLYQSPKLNHRTHQHACVIICPCQIKPN